MDLVGWTLAFGGSLAPQHTRNPAGHAELSQAKHQPPVTGMNRNKLPNFPLSRGKALPAEATGHGDWAASSAGHPQLPGSCPGTRSSSSSQRSLLPLISTGKLLWGSSVPFFPNAWIPQAPPSILPWLLSTSCICISKLSKTKVKPKLLFSTSLFQTSH